MMDMGDDVRDITLWCRHITQVGGAVRLFRRVLRNCSYRERSIETTLSTGQVISEMIIIRVFEETSGFTFIPPHIWNAKDYTELDGYWTCDKATPATMLAPFESNHEFGSFASSGAATTAESNFARLPENTGTNRVVEVNDNLGKIYRIDDDGNITISGTGRLGGHIRIRAGARAS